jgi:hypothetical protein
MSKTSFRMGGSSGEDSPDGNWGEKVDQEEMPRKERSRKDGLRRINHSLHSMLDIAS